MKKPILIWKQSEFVSNCPIYTVDYQDRTVLRIEFSLKENLWNVNVLNTWYSNYNETIHESDRIKVIAEELFENVGKLIVTLVDEMKLINSK